MTITGCPAYPTAPTGASIKACITQGDSMSASGELIRMMNYVDDIAATLRRIQSSVAFIDSEEKKRLAEYMRNANPNYSGIVERLEASE
jgi:hypothetical protein